MATMPNTPVLIGPVPLSTVTSLTLNEGYQVARVAGSTLAQLVSPTTTSIAIEATLIGPERGRVKQELEAIALTTRALASATAPLMALAGVPVVSGLTIHLDMQITSLRFSQSAERRDAIQASITLEHVPRSAAAELLGEALDLDLAAGFSAVPTAAQVAGVPRALGAPV